MKKLIPLLALVIPLVGRAATNEFDLAPGIDLTAQTNITASQLNQLVARGYPTNNKGMIYATNSTPDTTNNARYTNYIWLDYSTQPPTLKVWNASSNVWTAQSITNVTPGDNTVTSAKIVNGAVIAEDIATGAVTTSKISAGNVTTDTIADANVTRGKIADGAIDSTKLTNGAINSAALIGAGVIAGTNLAADAVGSASISNYSIGPLKFETNAVTGFAISNGVVTGAKLATNTVGATNIVLASLTTNLLTTNIYHLLPKVWAVCTGSAVVNQFGPASISTLTTTETGVVLVTFTGTPFASTNYAVLATPHRTAVASGMASYVSNTTSSVTLKFQTDAGSAYTPANFSILIYDNQ